MSESVCLGGAGGGTSPQGCFGRTSCTQRAVKSGVGGGRGEGGGGGWVEEGRVEELGEDGRRWGGWYTVSMKSHIGSEDVI